MGDWDGWACTVLRCMVGGRHDVRTLALRGRDRSRLLRVEGRLMCVLLGRLGRLGLAAWIPLCQALLLRLLTLVLGARRRG